MFWFLRRCKSFIIFLNHQWKLSHIPLLMKGHVREIYDRISSVRIPDSLNNTHVRNTIDPPPLPPLGPDGCMHMNRRTVNAGARFVTRCKKCGQVLRTAKAEKLEDYQARVRLAR